MTATGGFPNRGGVTLFARGSSRSPAWLTRCLAARTAESRSSAKDMPRAVMAVIGAETKLPNTRHHLFKEAPASFAPKRTAYAELQASRPCTLFPIAVHEAPAQRLRLDVSHFVGGQNCA